MCHPINTSKQQSKIQSYQQLQHDRNQTNDPATQATEPGNIDLFPSMTVTLPTSQTIQSDFITPPGLVAEIDDGIKTSLIEAEENRIMSKKLTLNKRELRLYQWNLITNNKGQSGKSQHIFLIYGIFFLITFTIVKSTIDVST